MPVVSRYCNICNRLITAREIESGEAIVYQTYYYCSKCKEEAMPIIEAIRRRHEREQEKEEAQAEKKKSSTRLGASPVKKYRPSPSAHKLRKPMSGSFPARKDRHAPRHRSAPGTDRIHHVRKPAAPRPAKQDAKPYKPTADFGETVKKTAGGAGPGAPAQPPEGVESLPDTELIEVIEEPEADILAEIQEMAIEEVAGAKPREADTGADEKLAASGITFEEVAPMTPAAAPEPGTAGREARAAPPSKEAAVPIRMDEQREPEPVEVEAEPQAREPREMQTEEVETGKAAAPPEQAPQRSQTAIGKFRKHVHPGKRHRGLHVPEKKKKPWLLIVIIIFMALGGGGLIAYRQFFMTPKELPSELKEKEEEKKRYAQLEKEVNALADRARKIAENPGDFEELSREMRELRMSAPPKELREKLVKAQETARERFASAAKLAFMKAKGEYKKALNSGSEEGLKAASAHLLGFPSVFKDTEYAKEEIPKLKAPVEKTLAVLRQFSREKIEAARLAGEGRFEEALSRLSGISYERAEVLPQYLKGLEKELTRLRKLAEKEKERREREAAARRKAFENAKKDAGKLSGEGRYQEAIDLLARFLRDNPGSEYRDRILQFTEKIVKDKRRAEIRNFFNGKDLKGWAVSDGWKVSRSCIAGVSADEKIWLLKGDPSWTDYTFEFDFNRAKGSLVLCLRAAPGEPQSGFTLEFGERPFVQDTWYHVKAEVSGGKAFITTSFNNERRSFHVKRASGIAGFLLPPGSEVSIRNVTMELPP